MRVSVELSEAGSVAMYVMRQFMCQSSIDNVLRYFREREKQIDKYLAPLAFLTDGAETILGCLPEADVYGKTDPCVGKVIVPEKLQSGLEP
jgi:hypothetical protein